MHDTHLYYFLFVAGLQGSLADIFKSLADDGNEQIEEKDDIEYGAEEEDNPVVFLVELNVGVEISQHCPIRLLPGDHVIL